MSSAVAVLPMFLTGPVAPSEAGQRLVLLQSSGKPAGRRPGGGWCPQVAFAGVKARGHGKQQLRVPWLLVVPQPLVPGSWRSYLGLGGYSQLLSQCQGVALSDCGVTMSRKLEQWSSGVLTGWPRPHLVMTCRPKLLILYCHGRICRTR